MATYGILKTNGETGELIGNFTTLTFVKQLRLVPVKTRKDENTPAYRVMVNDAEIGAVWEKAAPRHRPDLPFYDAGRPRSFPPRSILACSLPRIAPAPMSLSGRGSDDRRAAIKTPPTTTAHRDKQPRAGLMAPPLSFGVLDMTIKELFLRYRRFLQGLEAGSFYSLAVINV